jgi:AcrR family transcriptional regulator
VTRPVQARSQETLDRFLTAADSLLQEQPFDDITVAQIVDRAERTVGSFYARFADKDALVRTLAQNVANELVTDMSVKFAPDQWASTPIEELMRAAVGASATIFHRYAHVVRAALMLAARDEDARAFRQRNYLAMGHAFLAALRSHGDGQQRELSDQAIHDTIEVVTSVLDTRLLYAEAWQPGGTLDLDAEIEDITAIALRVLRGG